MSRKFKPNLGQPTEVENALTWHFNKLAKGRVSYGFEPDLDRFVDTSAMDEAIIKWGFWKQGVLAR